MKKYKKILLGLGLLVTVVSAVSILRSPASHALSAPIPYQGTGPKPTNKVEYWQTCAYKVAFSESGGVLDYCDISGSTSFSYGGSSLTPSAFQDATYKTRYGPTPPASITLLTADGSASLVLGKTSGQTLGLNNLSYINQSYIAGKAPDTKEIKFYVYQPGAGAPNGTNYALLASMNDNGSLQVLAMVYNVPTKDGKVLASTINKAAVGSTNTGGTCAAGDTSPTCGPGAPAGPTSGDTCEANSGGWSFAWAVCPVLDAASGLTNALIGLFEGQLSFTVGQLGSSSDPSSGASKVHQSWALIRDIATALVVVVMLIMVFSQALSFGPFDAYTVRKMLPKLAAAVILIQISWVGVSWIVDLVNAIARGLADLMYYPFGGSGNMDLFSLLANAKLGGVELGVLNWAAVGVVIALGVAFLFSMLGIAFVAITALFFAVLTLIFRKILIIALLIFVPLALLAWILPGTERYWKLWRENFLKALFMFPIAVAIIAVGRVFAYVVGSQNNGEFLNLLFILVGFFGPLFILPKTFKWGGQAMGLAGNAMVKASSKLSDRPKKFMDKRQEGWSAERRRQSEDRYQKGVGFNPRAPWRRPLDLLKSGQWDITQGAGRIAVGGRTLKRASRRRQQAMTGYAAAGAESEEKDVKEADTRAALMFAQVDDHDGLARVMANGGRDASGNLVDTFIDTRDGVSTGKTVKIGHVDEAMMRAGLNAVGKYGGDHNYQFLDRRVDQLRNGTVAEQELAKKFIDANVGLLQPKMKHIYYGPDRDSAISSSVESMSVDSFSGMEGVEMQAILESLSQRAAGGDASAVGSLRRVLTFYTSAINNPNIRINSGVNKAMEAFVDGQNLDDINLGAANPVTGVRSGGRVARGLRPIDRSIAADPGLTDEVAALTGRIDRVGNVQAPAAAAQPQQVITPTGSQPPPDSGRYNPPPGGSSTPV